MYLTLAPYGNRITGITRASRTYFGCDPQQLTLAQAAYLAALPQRPNRCTETRDADVSSVSRRMRDLHMITMPITARRALSACRLIADVIR